ncbi:unnamed protein product [Withania somnifera]
MNCLKIFILLAIITTILSVASSVDKLEEEMPVKDDNMVESFEVPLNETDDEISSSIRGGYPGPFCCKKKCLNVFVDRQNCGVCGKKCRYSETCCRGQCVNTLFHKRHCGGCGNKCQNGSACDYGMCSYAN